MSKLKLGTKLALSLLGLAAANPAMAGVNVDWTDWTSGNAGTGVAQGTITTSTTSIGVNYANANGYYFIQTGTGIDYFRNGIDTTANSPYTSSTVNNIPTASEMVALNQAGSQTLSFSQSVGNLFLSYVSLNGNGYGFIDQDFNILSYGDASDPGGPNNPGYWGSGTSYKQVVDLGNGHKEYELLGTGEPHGTIEFTGSFDTLTWISLTSETWNGFTVGVQGSARDVFPTPDSASTLSLLGAAAAGLALFKRRIK